MHSGNQIQVIRFAQCFYPQSHLTDLWKWVFLSTYDSGRCILVAHHWVWSAGRVCPGRLTTSRHSGPTGFLYLLRPDLADSSHSESLLQEVSPKGLAFLRWPLSCTCFFLLRRERKKVSCELEKNGHGVGGKWKRRGAMFWVGERDAERERA